MRGIELVNRHFGLTNALLFGRHTEPVSSKRFSNFSHFSPIFERKGGDGEEGHRSSKDPRFRFERGGRNAGEKERSDAVREWKTINSVEQSGKLRSNKFHRGES